MNQYQARKAIAQRWMSMWPGLSGNVPYVIDHDPFTEAPTYAHLTIDFEDSEQRSLGPAGQRKYTRPGMLMVELFVPPGSGSMLLDQLTQHVLTIFEGVNFGTIPPDELGVQTFASTHGKPRAAGQHVALTVGVEFEYYETR